MYQLDKVTKSGEERFALDDKVCLITSGAGFLGRQLAEALAEIVDLPVLFDPNIGDGPDRRCRYRGGPVRHPGNGGLN